MNEFDTNNKKLVDDKEKMINLECEELTKIVRQHIINGKEIDNSLYLNSNKKTYNTNCQDFKSLIKEVNNSQYVSLNTDPNTMVCMICNIIDKNKVKYIVY